MNLFRFYVFVVLATVVTGCIQGERNKNKNKKGDSTIKSVEASVQHPKLVIHPIRNATLVLEWKNTTIYVDPVGDAVTFSDFRVPDLILVTDTQGDHFSLETLEALNTAKAKLIVPQTVADRLPEVFTPQIDVLDIGDHKERYGIIIEAVSRYTADKESFKSTSLQQGNGYLLNMENERIYISGNTADIPSLKKITKAFVSMNLTYTIPIKNRADAILSLSPKEVFPYHCEGTRGYSNVQKFSELIRVENPSIKVTVLDYND